MSDQPEKAEKIRVALMSAKKRRFSVTLTPPFVDRLDRLVKEGIDLDHASAIRSALKMYFEYHGIPLTLEEAGLHE